MNFQRRRRWMSIFDIKKLNFRPIIYFYEIHGTTCAICLENMNIFKNMTTFRGCHTCSFWGHKNCIIKCNRCPQCREIWGYKLPT